MYITPTLGQNHRYYTCGLVYRECGLKIYLSSITFGKKEKKKKNSNGFLSLRKFFISNADCRRKCSASFNLFKAKCRSTFYLLKVINYCYAAFSPILLKPRKFKLHLKFTPTIFFRGMTVLKKQRISLSLGSFSC